MTTLYNWESPDRHVTPPLGRYVPASEDGIRAVQRALRVPIVGTWTEATKRALARLKVSYGDRTGATMDYATVSMLVAELAPADPAGAVALVVDVFGIVVPAGLSLKVGPVDPDGPVGVVYLPEEALRSTEALVDAVREALRVEVEGASPPPTVGEYKRALDELLTVGMYWRRSGFAREAARLLDGWACLPEADRARLRGPFVHARTRIATHLGGGDPLTHRWRAA